MFFCNFYDVLSTIKGLIFDSKESMCKKKTCKNLKLLYIGEILTTNLQNFFSEYFSQEQQNKSMLFLQRNETAACNICSFLFVLSLVFKYRLVLSFYPIMYWHCLIRYNSVKMKMIFVSLLHTLPLYIWIFKYIY